MKVIYFLSVWPEPWSSAAGVRSYQLIELFQNLGWEVFCVSSGAPNHAHNELSKKCHTLRQPINSSLLASELVSFSPNLVVYDRFILEEQFGWRIRSLWPKAIELIDTQDVHSLRRHRERMFRETGQPSLHTDVPINDESWIRERQALERVHAVWVVSHAEQHWLEEQGCFRSQYLPFSPQEEAEPMGFAKRNHFCFLGNLRHPPNLGAIHWLKDSLWPKVRAAYPSLELHIWGAYCPQWISEIPPSSGILFKGKAENVRATYSRYWGSLAPLPFGAGIKGKVLEAWAAGTPVVGNAVAFEGLPDTGLNFASDEDFLDQIGNLKEREYWETKSSLCVHALFPFRKQSVANLFKENMAALPLLITEAQGDFHFHALRSRHQRFEEYFSRWIEEKGAKAPLFKDHD